MDDKNRTLAALVARALARHKIPFVLGQGVEESGSELTIDTDSTAATAVVNLTARTIGLGSLHVYFNAA